LFLTGRATKTDNRASQASKPHDRARRFAAKEALKLTAVEFTGAQALSIVHGFQVAIDEAGYVLHARSILPNHVHAVLLRHGRPAERVVGHLKARATQQLVADGLHPFAEHRDGSGRLPSVWAHRAWKVFLDREADIRAGIQYVEGNPVKGGLRPQLWQIVTPF
jgi:hypothetical protein